MFVRVEEIIEQDEFQTQHGTLQGWKFRATDENNNECFLGINTKPGNTLSPGQEFDFQPSGKVVGVYTLGKRAQQQPGSGPNPYGGGQRQPQRPATSATPQRPGAPSGHANAPQTPSRATPKVSERLAEIHGLYPRALKMAEATAVKIRAEGAVMTADQVHALALSSAMNIIISLERGQVDHDPSAAQIEAERAAKLKAAQDEIDAAQARAAKLKADAEAQKAGPPGYAPADGGPAQAAAPDAPYGTDDGVCPF